MIKRITHLIFSSLILLTATSSVANTFYANLKENEVKAIFDRADKSQAATYLTNNSKKSIPAVQILPSSDNPKFTIQAATKCIKLYSCNQNICLVGLNDKKYATSETVLKQLTQQQIDNNACSANNTNTIAAELINKPTKGTVALYKVIKVQADDRLNVRQSAHYKAKKVGQLAYNASCIQRLSCKGKWCKIEQKPLSGWVHKSYLAPLNSSDAGQCSR